MPLKICLLLVYRVLSGVALPRGGSQDGATVPEVSPVISPGGGFMGLDQAKRMNTRPCARLCVRAINALSKNSRFRRGVGPGGTARFVPGHKLGLGAL